MKTSFLANLEILNLKAVEFYLFLIFCTNFGKLGLSNELLLNCRRILNITWFLNIFVARWLKGLTIPRFPGEKKGPTEWLLKIQHKHSIFVGFEYGTYNKNWNNHSPTFDKYDSVTTRFSKTPSFSFCYKPIPIFKILP